MKTKQRIDKITLDNNLRGAKFQVSKFCEKLHRMVERFTGVKTCPLSCLCGIFFSLSENGKE